MRILHVSDTHLGYQAYGRVNERGLNQREEDVFHAFRQVVDAAIELRPDAVLHSGDLFDSVRPTNRAVSFCLEELVRLGKSGIPFVVISGNHETPKLRETGSVFRFLEFFPNVHPVYRGAYERVRIGDLTVHAVPQCASGDALIGELALARPSGTGRHVLMAHVGVLGVEEFRSGEFNEQVVPSGALHPDFDYVALGHYHRHTQVSGNAWYAGSTERMSFGEAGAEKGYGIVDLESGSVDFHPLRTRPMIDLPALDCSVLSDGEVQDAILGALGRTELSGKIARLRVFGIPAHVHASLDFQRLRRETQEALHFQWKFEVTREDGSSGPAETTIGPLSEEFDRYVREVPLPGLDRERLLATARRFLSEVAA